MRGAVSSHVFPELGGKSIVKVVIGQSPEVTYWLHEEVLTSVSEHARSALSQSILEDNQRTVELPEEDATIFEMFVKYLYTRSVDTTSVQDSLQLYLLAERMQAPKLKDELYPSLSMCPDLFTSAQILSVLDTAARGDPLRESCIRRVCRDIRCSARPFPDVELGRVLCQKHAAEILAFLMDRYDDIIFQGLAKEDTEGKPAAEGNAATLLKPATKSDAVWMRQEFQSSASPFITGKVEPCSVNSLTHVTDTSLLLHTSQLTVTSGSAKNSNNSAAKPSIFSLPLAAPSWTSTPIKFDSGVTTAASGDGPAKPPLFPLPPRWTPTRVNSDNDLTTAASGNASVAPGLAVAQSE